MSRHFIIRFRPAAGPKGVLAIDRPASSPVLLQLATAFVLALMLGTGCGAARPLPAADYSDGHSLSPATVPTPRPQTTAGAGKDFYPWAALPFGSTCPVDQRILAPLMQVADERMFCVAWRDIFGDETGYRVVVTDYRTATEHSYAVGANVNELYIPHESWPLTVVNGPCTNCHGQPAYGVVLYVQRRGGEELLDRYDRFGGFVRAPQKD